MTLTPGNGHGHEASNGTRAVQLGSLIQGFIDVGQGRQVQNHVVGQPLPQRDEHGTEQDEPLIRQEGDRFHPPRGQQVVDRTPLIEEVAPRQRDDDQRGDGRQVVERTEETDAGNVRLDQESQQEGQQNHERDDAQSIDERIPQGLPELGVCEDRAVVVDADEASDTPQGLCLRERT